MTLLGKSTTVLNIPRINDPAPFFAIETNRGAKALTDYRGRWLLLSFHPVNLATPICTTELVAFHTHHRDFQSLNCDLLGISVGKQFSHGVWMQSLKINFDIEPSFPMGEDCSMRVARAYGMVRQDTQTCLEARTSFVIDNRGILRAIVYCPANKGRSVVEIVSLIEALQVPAFHDSNVSQYEPSFSQPFTETPSHLYTARD